MLCWVISLEVVVFRVIGEFRLRLDFEVGFWFMLQVGILVVGELVKMHKRSFDYAWEDSELRREL